MRALKIAPVFFIILLACSDPAFEGYKEGRDGVFFQYRAIGEEGRKISPGDYIKCRLVVYHGNGDTIIAPEYPVTFQLKTKLGVDRCIARFSVDDSFSLKWNNEEEWITHNSIKVITGDLGKDIHVADMRILSVKSSGEYLLDSLRFQENADSLESILIEEYITFEGQNQYLEKDSIYFKPLVSNPEGKSPEKGNFVKLYYTGRFLDGRIFDDTGKWKDDFEIQFGKPMQLIKGLEKALSWMKEGEVAKIILPSQQAFGKMGSSSGKIPPNTPLVYELKLLEIY